MEANWRWILVTAIAPVAWGANYYVTLHLLPTGVPLWGAALRALPAGLVLLALARRRPRGAWWWRSIVLGILNVGAFFVLVYVAAQLLPTSIASTVMAASPVPLMLLAWLLLRERPTVLPLLGAALGIGGVALMLLAGQHALDVGGVIASVTAMVMSSIGFVLAKRWNSGADRVAVLDSTSWQLVAGGVLLVVAALAVEGPPPTPTAASLAGFAFVSLVATALAFWAWFTGLAKLPAASVGLIGLLNPVTGVALGVALAGEGFSGRQLAGIALVLVGVLLGQPIARLALERRRDRRREARPVSARG